MTSTVAMILDKCREIGIKLDKDGRVHSAPPGQPTMGLANDLATNQEAIAATLAGDGRQADYAGYKTEDLIKLAESRGATFWYNEGTLVAWMQPGMCPAGLSSAVSASGDLVKLIRARHRRDAAQAGRAAGAPGR